jgi:hypothetical protein
VNFSRFYLNIGEKDGISPARLIGQINDASGSASIKVGRIEILDHTAMLEADSRFAQKVLEVFQGLKVNGRDVEVKTLDAPKGRPAKPAYPGRKGAKPYKSSGSSYKPSSASSYKPSASARPVTSAKPYPSAKPYSSSKPSTSAKPYPSARPATSTRPPSAGVPRRGKKKPYSDE